MNAAIISLLPWRLPYRSLLGFNDLKLRLLGIPFLTFFIPTAFFDVLPWQNWKLFAVHAFSSAFYSALYWHVDRWLIAYFRFRFPSAAQYRRRMVWQVVTVLSFTLVFCNFLHVTCWVAGVSLPLAASDTFRINIASITITVAIAAIYEAVYGVAMWKRTSIETERYRRETAVAQLDALKSQVNPHFLFNSLNALVSMVHEQPDQAVQFIHHLSSIYRNVIAVKDKELVTLEEELASVDSYKFLIETRFAKNVEFNIRVSPSSLRCWLPPLSLQLLVENAVKHNVISQKRPLTILIKADNNELTVQNNFQPKLDAAHSTGTGLGNIKSRYAMLSDRPVQVRQSLEHFTVVLPLLNHL